MKLLYGRAIKKSIYPALVVRAKISIRFSPRPLLLSGEIHFPKVLPVADRQSDATRHPVRMEECAVEIR